MKFTLTTQRYGTICCDAQNTNTSIKFYITLSFGGGLNKLSLKCDIFISHIRNFSDECLSLAMTSYTSSSVNTQGSQTLSFFNPVAMKLFLGLNVLLEITESICSTFNLCKFYLPSVSPPLAIYANSIKFFHPSGSTNW